MREGLMRKASLPIRSPKSRRSEPLICSSISISFFRKQRLWGIVICLVLRLRNVLAWMLMRSLVGLRTCRFRITPSLFSQRELYRFPQAPFFAIVMQDGTAWGKVGARRGIKIRNFVFKILHHTISIYPILFSVRKL